MGAAHAPTARARAKAITSAVGGGWDKNADEIAKTLEAGDYNRAYDMLEERRSRGLSEPPGLMVVRGWTLYHRGDWEGAKRTFAGLQTDKQQADAAKAGLDTVKNAELPTPLRSPWR